MSVMGSSKGVDRPMFPCRVVLFGDSITNGYQSWVDMFANDTLLQTKLGPDYTVEKCGVNGERTSAMVDRFSDFIAEMAPNEARNVLFVFLGGTNDMARFQDIEEVDMGDASGEENEDAICVVANLQRMFAMALEVLGARVVCLTAPSMCISNVTPTHILYRYHVNNLLRKLCSEMSIPCVDLFTITSCPTTHKLLKQYSGDGLHLSPAAYEAVYTVLAQRIKLFGATAAPVVVPTPYTIAVPEHYRGLWRRDFIRRKNGQEDHDTKVMWLQGARWHGDIRIPANRPPFDGITSINECNEAQLRALLTQTGFVGVTDVSTTISDVKEDGLIGDGSSGIECCTWYQRGDYNPSDDIDAGRITFINSERSLMEEVGLDGSYFEQWRRDNIPRTTAAYKVPLTKLTLDPTTEEVQVLLLVEGGHFFLYRNDRSGPCRSMKQAIEAWKLYMEVASSASSRVDDIVLALMRELASVEISFGIWDEGRKEEEEISHGVWGEDTEEDGGEGRILLSTYPWREGCIVTAKDATSAAAPPPTSEATLSS